MLCLLFMYRETKNFSARSCHFQKADADVDWSSWPVSHKEKPLFELQRALGGRGEREK